MGRISQNYRPRKYEETGNGDEHELECRSNPGPVTVSTRSDVTIFDVTALHSRDGHASRLFLNVTVVPDIHL